MKLFRKIIFAAVAIASLAPSHLFACAACFGKSSDPLAHGMNWGIFTLLCVLVFMLASIAGFFVFLARKAAALEKNSLQQNPVEV